MSIIPANIYFPPCPNTRNRKIIRAWEAERAEFDSYIERINQTMSSLGDEKSIVIEDLFCSAELAMLSLGDSFNFHVKRLMGSYPLCDDSKQLITDLMRCKYFKLKDVHRLIMNMKHDCIVRKEIKELDQMLEKFPQWRLEDGTNKDEINKWWVKRNYSTDRKTVMVTKIMRGLEAVTEKYLKLSANFDAATGQQIDAEQVESSANLLELLG